MRETHVQVDYNSQDHSASRTAARPKHNQLLLARQSVILKVNASNSLAERRKHATRAPSTLPPDEDVRVGRASSCGQRSRWTEREACTCEVIRSSRLVLRADLGSCREKIDALSGGQKAVFTFYSGTFH
ncbi:hypothetical protein EYF80_017550 [Liparis tanakae]|uniref:Uncharacterized protein n=1 Tax=Liparis tanakae TaxID=230148 RepID=A0A4Z2I2H2_9TELE|nr:hypothetical protein EYF80_017550 [Liparis tanakae]